MARQEASLFFRLVSYRYGRGAMLINRQEHPRLDRAARRRRGPRHRHPRRLLHRSHVLNVKGRSDRLRDLDNALKLATPDLSAPTAMGTRRFLRSARPSRPHRS
jgi:hypothetical protein